MEGCLIVLLLESLINLPSYMKVLYMYGIEMWLQSEKDSDGGSFSSLFTFLPFFNPWNAVQFTCVISIAHF